MDVCKGPHLDAPTGRGLFDQMKSLKVSAVYKGSLLFHLHFTANILTLSFGRDIPKD